MMMCAQDTDTPRYPSLYYLFPMVNHDLDGAPLAGETGISPPFVVDHSQGPANEEYVTQMLAYPPSSGSTFTVLKESSSGSGIDDNGHAEIAVVPRSQNPLTWALPVTAAPGNRLSPETMDIRIEESANDGNFALTLLDKVLYNGREEMTVRVLDFDLQKLTRTRNGTGTTADYWISDRRGTNSGIFYAAREDAVREDSINRRVSRPGGVSTTWTMCNQ